MSSARETDSFESASSAVKRRKAPSKYALVKFNYVILVEKENSVMDENKYRF